MDDAVSRLGELPRIQTTPEIRQNNRGTGLSVNTVGGASPRATYRTWPVFSFALLALLALMLVPALTAMRRSEAIYDEIRRSQEQFQQTQRLFDALSQNVFTISLTIRDFLLDNSPDAGRTYRARLTGARDQLQTDIARLGEVLPADGKATLQELREQVDEYVAVVLSVFDWTSKERAERGAYFLREEQRPRRETILAVARNLSQLSAAVYTEQQRRTTESEQAFRRGLFDSVLFALVTGLVVSTGGILRMRWLERRAAEQREQSEETTAEIRQLSGRLRQAQEEERRSIARELHDDVGQKLTALRMELGALERLRAADHAEFDACVGELKSMAEQSLHVIRDIAGGLRPAVLDDLGLAAAVQKQAREFTKRTGVVVSVSVDGPFDRVADPQRTCIYRIVQEALTNCAKHSRARAISVALVDTPDRIELSVTDDGAGFDPDKIPHDGMGLVGMQERARELGGIAEVHSAPGRGTAIRVSIPR